MFKQLVEKTRLFIEGKEHSTQWHMGPLCPESEIILPKLKLLNDHNVVTICSQPTMDGQIAYLSGVVQTKKELDELISLSEIYVWCEKRTEDHHSNMKEKRICVTRDGDKEFTYIHNDNDIRNDFINCPYLEDLDNWYSFILVGKKLFENIEQYYKIKMTTPTP